MAVHAAHDSAHGHSHHHQFEDIEQQNESYIVGMWAFLVTEIMFFGAMFLAYSIYRWKFPEAFYLAHKELNVPLGATNTTILLFSSFLMALSVRFKQLHNRKATVYCLIGVILCAVAFMVIKLAFEWPAKFQHDLYPGFPTFMFHAHPDITHEARLFFGLYFTMTGLHGLHVVIGIVILGVLAVMIWCRHRLVDNDYIPLEMAGLYWHFVDIVWIFLFPLYYLIPAG